MVSAPKERRVHTRQSPVFSLLFARCLVSRDYDFYGEAEFNALLRIERKRTERSGRPFLLMLLDARGLEKGRGRTKALERIAYALCSCSRKTDAKGWYREREVFGVAFTEIASDGPEIGEKLVGKVTHCLSLAMVAEEVRKLKITLHSYPEKKNAERGATCFFDLCLYPDLVVEGKHRPFSAAAKRIMDLLGGFCAVIALSPLLLVIAAGVKLTTPGPILFRQRRLGLAGKEFTLLKFRSMYADSDPKDHMEYVSRYISGEIDGCKAGTEGKGVYKIRNDRRVTPVGRLLRKTSLDELPQFLNVLKGEMSLVGPRPPIPYEYEQYETWHRRRVLEVKPGLTGLWQVKGRSATAFDEMVRMDLRYANARSFWLDLKILLQTPGSVISGHGAY